MLLALRDLAVLLLAFTARMIGLVVASQLHPLVSSPVDAVLAWLAVSVAGLVLLSVTSGEHDWAKHIERITPQEVEHNMPTDNSPRSLTALLPNGQRFVPGMANPAPTTATCPGPDAWGYCPALIAGRAPVCEAATWVLQSASGRSWTFRFRSGLQECPVTLLTPTGE
jgi:hypothetical protein